MRKFRSPVPQDVMLVSGDEVRLALALVSDLDPDSFKHPAAKSLIYKMKDAHQTDSKYRSFRILDGQ